MFKSAACILLFALIFQTSHAQETIINCTDSVFCVPGVVGLPRSKGIVIKRELVRDYLIRSESDGGKASAEIRRNRRWEFKLRAPIILKDGFKMAAGIKYYVEEFNFENPESLNFPFYQNLEDRSLRSIRGDIFIVKPTLTNKYYILRLSGGLNGDYSSESFAKSDFFKFSISSLMGWKKNDYVSYAFGVAFSYGFGRRSVYPIIVYNKSFNNKWGIESILPAEIKLRYSTLNQKNYFYAKAELHGANYSVRLDEAKEDLVYLNKSEVRFLLSWEREIHDWLWFGVEGGLRSNINFDLSSDSSIRTDVVIENSLNQALVYNFSIFVVPPRKMLK
ncbi:DUF6268 family outer membrane beta-barrel protein [Fulvivirga imtechensis]|uniref:DUF6268 family outer membrane beta-barrel protein n=1 Tax=Fulvivirga imtechensis TaxID=881893 RepID=UPI00058FD901|nr:DUF6268 family outer membrane beta-barrel protein [Fulvivirga imtechensis]